MVEVGKDVAGWLLQNFGPLNSILLGFCGYIAWLHHKEVEAHGVTRAYILEMQEKALSAQASQTVVLAEIRTLLQKRRA